MDEWTVAELLVYPVKSCQGVSLASSPMTATGLKYDRHWMLVDKRGRFVTQRQCPRLALIRVEIDEAGGEISLHTDEMPTLRMPLNPGDTDLGERLQVRVWYDMVAARHCPQADAWVTQFVGKPTRLLYKDTERPRLVSRYVPKDCVDAPQSRFADVFPLHITCSPSLADINTRVDRPLTHAHFRPNIVLASPTARAYDEEEWTRIEVNGSWSIMVTSRTPRCSMTNMDLKAGAMYEDKEPLSTLRTFRCVDPAKPAFVCFGMQAAPQRVGHTIRVGDSIVVRERGYHALTEPL
ncbi:hypothetical protein H4S01_003688 [Coemansia sp. RSA 2610]|nr:hypothetical protein H4S01_003688 [Coemansia sp. RSA 2610]